MVGQVLTSFEEQHRYLLNFRFVTMKWSGMELNKKGFNYEGEVRDLKFSLLAPNLCCKRHEIGRK